MSSPGSPDEHPRIGEHRLIGDGRSAALVTPGGTIDWWCAPRFDSPPVFWSLLDPGGASARFVGVTPVEVASAAAARTTRTTVRNANGRIIVWDGLVDGCVFRIVAAIDSDLDVVHATSFGGFDHAAPSDAVELRLRAARGRRTALVIDSAGVETLDASFAVDKLRAADEAFGEAYRMRRPRSHQSRSRDAFAVSRLSTYAPTGAVVASVTTSLPEAPGGDRQFDYRYAWLRDGSLVASVAALEERLDLARDHLGFVERLGRRIFEAPLFTVDGESVPSEREIDGVRGWRDSTPIRVGNAAAAQIQYDALGFVVEAVSTYTREGGRLTTGMWKLVREIADRCARDDHTKTSGIWELREPRELLAADIGRWLALDRAIRIARRRRPWTRRRSWRRAKEELRARVLGALEPDGRLPQQHGGSADELDASALLIVMFGMLDGDDQRAAALVDAHLAGLSEGHHLRRYSPIVDDGFSGTDATFVPCSWWAVTALVAIGRLGEAEERTNRLCADLPPLLAEEFDPSTGDSLGNVGLVWAHAELARALRVIEVARLRARWGDAGVAADRLRRQSTRVARAVRRFVTQHQGYPTVHR